MITAVNIINVKDNDNCASKPVFKHFNLPSHSSKSTVVYSIYLHQGNTESCKNPERKLTLLYLIITGNSMTTSAAMKDLHHE